MGHRGSCCDLCQRVFSLCSPLGVLYQLYFRWEIVSHSMSKFYQSITTPHPHILFTGCSHIVTSAFIQERNVSTSQNLESRCTTESGSSAACPLPFLVLRNSRMDKSRTLGGFVGTSELLTGFQAWGSPWSLSTTNKVSFPSDVNRSYIL